MAALVQIMACPQASNKPLSEAKLICCADAYMRHSASMSWLLVDALPIFKLISRMDILMTSCEIALM